MAEESPLSATGSLTEVQYEALAHAQAADGLIGSPTDTPPVSVSGGQVIVRAGLNGVVRGYPWASGSSPLVYTPSLAGAARTDLVVLRLFRDDNFRVGSALRAGTSTTAPTPAVGTGPTDWYEVPLAEIGVSGGTLSLQRTRAWYLGEDGQVLCWSGGRPPHAAGRQIYETDTGRGYISTGSRWVPIVDDAGVVTPTLASGWAASGIFLSRINGVAYLNGSVKRTGASLTTASATAAVLTIPVGYRPRYQFTHAARVVHSGADAAMRITTTGAVNVDLYGGGCATNQYIDLASACWPVAIS